VDHIMALDWWQVQINSWEIMELGILEVYDLLLYPKSEGQLRKKKGVSEFVLSTSVKYLV
jgi:hypothetical protein